MPRLRALGLIFIAYLAAAAAALLTGYALRGQHPLLVAGLADLAATAAIFAFSLSFRNSSFYDAYWSLIPIWIGAYYLALGGPADPARAWLVMAGICLWGIRLTWNWILNWEGIGHEDWRYGQLKAQSGRWYPLVNFGGIHLFPTVMVYLGCLPVYGAMVAGSRPLGLLDAVAAAVTAAAVLLETVADQQLRTFRRTNTDPQAFLNTGLWALCRHPNYLGEILFWIGMALFGMAAAPESWWQLAGAAAMIGLFAGFSIPVMDRRMVQKRPAYAEHMRKVHALLPWPRRA